MGGVDIRRGARNNAGVTPLSRAETAPANDLFTGQNPEPSLDVAATRRQWQKLAQYRAGFVISGAVPRETARRARTCKASDRDEVPSLEMVRRDGAPPARHSALRGSYGAERKNTKGPCAST